MTKKKVPVETIDLEKDLGVKTEEDMKAFLAENPAIAEAMEDIKTEASIAIVEEPVYSEEAMKKIKAIQDVDLKKYRKAVLFAIDSDKLYKKIMAEADKDQDVYVLSMEGHTNAPIAKLVQENRPNIFSVDTFSIKFVPKDKKFDRIFAEEVMLFAVPEEFLEGKMGVVK